MMNDMQVYIGTKVINAAPMTRTNYNLLRGFEQPKNEGVEDDGYLVEYVDPAVGTQPNTPQFSGYVSWSPKAVFERAYTHIQSMTFGIALELCKQGYRIARQGWNGKGQYLVYVDPGSSPAELIKMRPWIGIHTVDNQFMPWVASQSDMLCSDWVVVGRETE